MVYFIETLLLMLKFVVCNCVFCFGQDTLVNDILNLNEFFPCKTKEINQMLFELNHFKSIQNAHIGHFSFSFLHLTGTFLLNESNTFSSLGNNKFVKYWWRVGRL